MTPLEFQTLYEKTFGLVSHSLNTFRLSHEEREDVVQGTYLAFWLYVQTESVQKPAGFLVASARNRALTLLRKRKVHATHSIDFHGELCASLIPSANGEAAKEAEQREKRIDIVRQALTEHRASTNDDTLWQRYAQGRKLTDIAAARGEPLGTVCARVNVSRLPKRLVESVRTSILPLREVHL
ncbi:MAG: sigma-70 family RNA polymerase sigma factor [Silvanigrellales bacterium]|nr:sigma-70 family RNA polymerase sigma factor [Silvanigrellales bacterium]